jgi:hypothetical protein
MPTKIQYFDCSDEQDMRDAEMIIAKKQVDKKEVVSFPYLMLVYQE